MEFWLYQEDYLNEIFPPLLILSLIGLAGLIAAFAFGFWWRSRLWKVGESESRTDEIGDTGTEFLFRGMGDFPLSSRGMGDFPHSLCFHSEILSISAPTSASFPSILS